MLGLLLVLLFLAFVGAFSPVLISVCILILTGRRPLANAIAYAVGIAVVLILGGAVVLRYLGDVLQSFFRQPAPTPVISLLIGGICLALALRSYLHLPEPDAPPPEWLDTLETLEPWKAALFGIALAGTNLKLLLIYSLGLWMIIQADLSLLFGMLFLVAFSIGLMAGVLVPIAITIGAPKQADELLDQLRQLLTRLTRPLTIMVLVVIGLFLAVRGMVSMFT